MKYKISLRPREISWVSGNLGRRGWIFQYLTPLGGARIQSSLAMRFAEEGLRKGTEGGLCTVEEENNMYVIRLR